ncbi:uncharacterized protein LOC128745702 [Sabethes cyaneus]|uniref:uncharacterized protein LOC128745702 n=1 Tax=Sabethes cyaneus TaxID=53552 RepID=UPI00237D7F57|nr:uncharacterized protein LOC128745702 [Sabethes cyaneus]
MIDNRLKFNGHVDYACEKAAKAISALSRIMPNNFGPSSSKRRLLASVSSSILRYGGPAWITALQTQRNRAKLRSTARLMTIRVVSAYRTISSEAACVIAGMIPIDITLMENYECYRQKEVRGIRKLMRAESLAKWQQECNTTQKAWRDDLPSGLNVENMVEDMCRNESIWNAVNSAIACIVS